MFAHFGKDCHCRYNDNCHRLHAAHAHTDMPLLFVLNKKIAEEQVTEN